MHFEGDKGHSNLMFIRNMTEKGCVKFVFALCFFLAGGATYTNTENGKSSGETKTG